MWNMKHVPHCPQNIWAVAVDQLWLCGWNQAFSPKRLQINKYRNIISVSTRIAATYFFPFHLKLHGVKVVIFCLSLAKVTATRNSCKGTTTWLLLSSHAAKFQTTSSNAAHSSQPIISMIVGEKVKNLSTVKLVASMACQVYQITMGTQAMLDSGMVAAADISQVCQISAAKGTNFLAKDFACNKPGSIANTSGSESLSISRVKTS